MSLVLDSNILVKLVTGEPGSKEARASITSFLKKGYGLYTVDVALAEGFSAVWKHVKIHRDLKLEDAYSTVQDLAKIYDKLTILTVRELLEEVKDIAFTQNITVYDSFYTAAARRMGATLYTADEKLHNLSRKITVSKLLKF